MAPRVVYPSTVTDFLTNNPKCRTSFFLLAAIIESEDQLWYSQPSEEGRIQGWMNRAKQHINHKAGCNDNFGVLDCVACQVNAELDATVDIINDALLSNPGMSAEKAIYELLEIVLSTQPQRRFATRQEFTSSDITQEMRNSFTLSYRKASYLNLDTTTINQNKARIDLLHTHMRNIMMTSY